MQRRTHYEVAKKNVLDKQKEYYQKNKETILQRCRNYRDNNLEKARMSSNRTYQKNKIA